MTVVISCRLFGQRPGSDTGRQEERPGQSGSCALALTETRRRGRRVGRGFVVDGTGQRRARNDGTFSTQTLFRRGDPGRRGGGRGLFVHLV